MSRAANAPQRAALVAALVPPLALVAVRAEAGEPLALGRDVVALESPGPGGQQANCCSRSSSHDGSDAEAWEAEGGPPASAEALRALLSRRGGGGLALRQPQRFDDALWRLMAALERQLGCLVGAEVVAAAAPPGGAPPAWAEGPHIESCEAFVLQAQGGATWRVFQPAAGAAPAELANARRAVPPAQLGPLALEARLQVGGRRWRVLRAVGCCRRPSLPPRKHLQALAPPRRSPATACTCPAVPSASGCRARPLPAAAAEGPPACTCC